MNTLCKQHTFQTRSRHAPAPMKGSSDIGLKHIRHSFVNASIHIITALLPWPSTSSHSYTVIFSQVIAINFHVHFFCPRSSRKACLKVLCITYFFFTMALSTRRNANRQDVNRKGISTLTHGSLHKTNHANHFKICFSFNKSIQHAFKTLNPWPHLVLNILVLIVLTFTSHRETSLPS